MLIGDTPFELVAARTLQWGKLDSTGKLEWWRTLGDSPNARISAITWNAKAGVWVVAGDVEAHPFRPFDFENVTQTATFVSGVDAFVARFAD
ncbi:hypothetical protein D3C83_17520 [compost metagenome]